MSDQTLSLPTCCLLATRWPLQTHCCLNVTPSTMLTMRIRLGSRYLMLIVEPSAWTRRTGYSLSYFGLLMRTTDVRLESLWTGLVWSDTAGDTCRSCNRHLRTSRWKYNYWRSSHLSMTQERTVTSLKYRFLNLLSVACTKHCRTCTKLQIQQATECRFTWK